MQEIDQLNARFGIEGALHFEAGRGGLVNATLRSTHGSSVTLYLFGAHITSWKNVAGNEMLFLSPKSEFTPGKAIRGGMPLVFPQFGGGALPSHGFARTNFWVVESASKSSDGSTQISLSLDAALLWKDHACRVVLEVVLGSGLITRLRVTNTHATELTFQNAFHTYFKIDTISTVVVEGLSGLSYFDKVANTLSKESRIQVMIDRETDRIYQAAPNVLYIKDIGANRTLTLKKANLNDAVVWNPWKEGTARIKDLAAESYQHFICVESGNIDSPIHLAPSETWSAEQILEG